LSLILSTENLSGLRHFARRRLKYISILNLLISQYSVSRSTSNYLCLHSSLNTNFFRISSIH
jgi:hypothetical protein